mgnify:CR=1 FL=1
MKITSSSNSTNILIRPGVLERSNVFFFSPLLHPLTSRMRTEARAKALAEQRNVKFYLFRRGNLSLCMSVDEASFHAEKGVVSMSSLPTSRPASGSHRVRSEPLSELD